MNSPDNQPQNPDDSLHIKLPGSFEDMQNDPVANTMLDVFALCFVLFRSNRQEELQLLYRCAEQDESLAGKPLFQSHGFLTHFGHLKADKRLPERMRNAILSILRKNPDGTITPINPETKQSGRSIQANPFAEEDEDGNEA